jgi:tRNA nucleotidyltransferase (CCA-adding enzyme)
VTKLTCLLCDQPQPWLIQETLSRLTYSHREIKLVQTLLSALNQLPAALAPDARESQFFLFRQVGVAWPGLVLLGIAMGIAAADLEPLTQAWLTFDHPIAHPPCLMTGAELIQQFKFRPGPEIGQILRQIEQAQAEGKLLTTAQAQAWVRAYVSDRAGEI